MKYRSKPIEIEAMQWVSGNDNEDLTAARLVRWVNVHGGEARYKPSYKIHPDVIDCEEQPARIAVHTINGWAYAAPGHYIMMGTATFWSEWDEDGNTRVGLLDFYPCDPGTFERRWEPAVPPNVVAATRAVDSWDNEQPRACESGCGCRYGTTDPDQRDCACDGPCSMAEPVEWGCTPDLGGCGCDCPTCPGPTDDERAW